MKKYAQGGAPMTSPRPKPRPERLPMANVGGAPKRSLRPRRRPRDMEMEDDGGAVERGNRAAAREAYDMRTLGPGSGMKKGGKVRGYGKARGAKPCKMC